MGTIVTSKIRYNVEHQRNIAYDLLDFKRREISLSSCFGVQEPVIIYGFDFLGKEIYQEIKDRVDIVCFIDRAYDGEAYDGIPVFSLNNEELVERTRSYVEIKLLVAIVSDTEKIVRDVTEYLTNITYVSLYRLFSECKIKSPAFVRRQNDKTLEVLHEILEDRETGIKNIVLTGTTYTMLLSMLYLEDWEESVFIMERFVPEAVACRMQEMGLRCLYEKQSVEYYDICYMISEYAAKHHIPVWGHDHMRLSRAFLTNGIHILEDGLGNYQYSYAERHMIILDDGRRYMPMGYDTLVQKMVLTGQFPLPKEMLNKIEVITPSLLWRKKPASEKQSIAEIMGFSLEEISEQVKSGKTIIFLTEPHISGGEMQMEEEEQITLYQGILSNYPKSEIMIKPHPGDKIDYAEKLPGFYIMDRKFPIQMIDWFNIGIEKYIVMKGSSSLNFLKNGHRVDVYEDEMLVEKWERENV